MRAADEWLAVLLAEFARLRFVVFVGPKAMHAQKIVLLARPGVEIVEMPHMSRQSRSGNRSRCAQPRQGLHRILEAAMPGTRSIEQVLVEGETKC